MKKVFLSLGMLVLVGSGIWFFLHEGKAGKVKVLETAVIERGVVSTVLEATGVVKTQVGAQVKIGARATGVLKNVPFKVGDFVHKGDLVAEIDSRELCARISEAEANLRLQEAKLRYAEKTLPRKKYLVKKKLESQDVLDQASQDVQIARHAVASSRSKLETLHVQLSYSKIFSPIDGVVSQVAAHEGETVVSGLSVSNLITVVDPSRLEMWVYIDETDIGRVLEGQLVRYTVDAYRDRAYEGTISRIYPEPEIRDNIVYYRALVLVAPEQAQSLRPEMTTQCKIVVETRSNVLAIPNQALKWVGNEQVVFVVEDSQQEPRETHPELGLAGLRTSEVLSGLKAGDVVATQLVLPDDKIKKAAQ